MLNTRLMLSSTMTTLALNWPIWPIIFPQVKMMPFSVTLLLMTTSFLLGRQCSTHQARSQLPLQALQVRHRYRVLHLVTDPSVSLLLLADGLCLQITPGPSTTASQLPAPLPPAAVYRLDIAVLGGTNHAATSTPAELSVANKASHKRKSDSAAAKNTKSNTKSGSSRRKTKADTGQKKPAKRKKKTAAAQESADEAVQDDAVHAVNKTHAAKPQPKPRQYKKRTAQDAEEDSRPPKRLRRSVL